MSDRSDHDIHVSRPTATLAWVSAPSHARTLPARRSHQRPSTSTSALPSARSSLSSSSPVTQTSPSARVMDTGTDAGTASRVSTPQGSMPGQAAWSRNVPSASSEWDRLATPSGPRTARSTRTDPAGTTSTSPSSTSTRTRRTSWSGMKTSVYRICAHPAPAVPMMPAIPMAQAPPRRLVVLRMHRPPRPEHPDDERTSPISTGHL